MKIFASLIILFPVLFVACSKGWLEEKPDKSIAVPLTINDLQSLLDNYSLNNVFSTVFFAEIASDGHYYSDNEFNSYRGSMYQNAYTWSNDAVYSSVNDWNGVYNAILSLNVVLDRVDKLSASLDAEQIKGQALFQRSRLFYSLAQTFSPSYDYEVARTSLGVPLRLTSDITVPTVRASLFDTYNQIVNDLKASADLLLTTPEFITRGSKPAALALIARVYLTMQEYDSAFAYSDRCIEIKNTLLDYNTIPLDRNFIGINSEVLFASFFPVFPLLTANYLVDTTLYNLYDSSDLRKQLFFSNRDNRIQFKGSYGNSATDIFSGIALDEVYLIRSECHARLGRISLAMKDLNDLMRKRWKRVNGNSTYLDVVAINKNDALRVILKEREKQLILRGIRWSDLRRLNIDPNFAVTLKRTVFGKSYILEPNSYRYTFPIPNDIIQKTGILQNSGWDD